MAAKHKKTNVNKAQQQQQEQQQKAKVFKQEQINDDSSDDDAPVEVSSKKSIDDIKREIEQIHAIQTNKRKKRKTREHNKLNLYAETEDGTDDKLDLDILNQLETQQKQEEEEKQKLSKKRRRQDNVPVIKSIDEQQERSQKKRRIFADLGLQVRVAPEQKNDRMENLLSMQPVIDSDVSEWLKKHLIMRVNRIQTAKWLSEKRMDATVAPSEVFVPSKRNYLYFHL